MLLEVLCIIIWPSVNANWSYSPETFNSGESLRFFVLYDLEILRNDLKKQSEGNSSLYMDLSKVFDTLDHDVLDKLSHYGYEKITLQWFSSY